jgi:glutamyl-tRNA synthetase
MEITHVIRSEEWISSTPKHMLMYAALGWNPPEWVHPPLILGQDGAKLSKRHGAVRFLDYKEKGYLPETMMNFIALLGWSPGEDKELFTTEELIDRFSIDGIVNHPVKFDLSKLDWMNGVYMRQADLGRITELCLPFLVEAGLMPESPSPEELSYAKSVIALEKDRMKVLSEAPGLTEFFFKDDYDYEEKGMRKWLSRDYVPELLRHLVSRIESSPEFSIESLEEAVRMAGEDMDMQGGQVIHPVRMAVTGRTAGPGLFETMEVLGKARVTARLNRTIGVLSESRDD